ncbi:MAG: hypothetical protein Q9167_004853, partial [Letrouitia subvulpina]
MAPTTRKCPIPPPFPSYLFLSSSPNLILVQRLDHGLCTAFEKLPTYTSIGPHAFSNFSSTFLPRLRPRLASALAPTNLTDTDILNLLDLCPFVTISDSATGVPFCALFAKHEWRDYDYLQTLSKFYSYGPGNPLGPTQGVGFVNELIARLTNQPVKDATSVNHTLDAYNSSTFPLMDKGLYVD